MSALVLEIRGQEDTGILSPRLAMTPPIDEDYWSFRVRLSDTQAIVGFPKFFTIGIGFAREEDWNTNLPYTTAAGEIYDHIAHNKGDDSITREDCITAIEMVQAAARQARQEATA
jgi:hypothetical protein